MSAASVSREEGNLSLIRVLDGANQSQQTLQFLTVKGGKGCFWLETPQIHNHSVSLALLF